MVDEARVGAVAAALRAVVDPDRGHPELLGGLQVAGHVLDQHRSAGIDTEPLAQQAIAVRVRLGPQLARMNVVQVVEVIADADRRSARSTATPTLDLVATAGRQDTSEYDFGQEVDDARVGVELNMPIYSGGVNSARIRQAKANAIAADADLKRVTLETERSARQLYRQRRKKEGIPIVSLVGIFMVFGTLRLASWLEKTALVLCDVKSEKTHDYVPVAPRSILRRQVEQAKSAGFTAFAATELEHYLFRTSFRDAARQVVVDPPALRHDRVDRILEGG